MIAVLKEEEQNRSFDVTMIRFERDHYNFDEFKNLPSHTPELARTLKRSQFNVGATNQYVEAAKGKRHGQYTEETTRKVKTVTRDKIAGILQTEFVEEVNGVQK